MFFWSILAHLHPCEKDHPNRVSIYEQYFDEINFEGFDFTNRFKCSDVYKFEKLINLSINILNYISIKIKTNGNIIWYLLKLVKMNQIELMTY